VLGHIRGIIDHTTVVIDPGMRQERFAGAPYANPHARREAPT
jgi:hypothetical protein